LAAPLGALDILVILLIIPTIIIMNLDNVVPSGAREARRDGGSTAAPMGSTRHREWRAKERSQKLLPELGKAAAR